MAELEKAGKTTVGFAAQRFERDWKAAARAFGFPDLPYAIFPTTLTGVPPTKIEEYVDQRIDEIISIITTGNLAKSGEASVPPAQTEVFKFEGGDRYDAFRAMSAAYLDRGWGDGHPLLPPTREAVDSILKGTPREPNDVVAIMAPGNGIATVEKIAINAAMAGCSSEHLPLLIAGIEAMTTPPFPLRNLSQSTGGQGLLFIVNGPIGKRLGINSDQNVLDTGKPSRINIMLARTFRLMQMNIGLGHPGVLDMATIGAFRTMPFLAAEAEDRSPWEPFHMDHGFDKLTSTIAVCGRQYQVDCTDLKNYTAKGILTTIAGFCSMVPHGGYGGRARDNPVDHYAQLNILLSPDHAGTLAREGVKKSGLKDFVFNNAKTRARFVKNKYAEGYPPPPEWRWLMDVPDDDLLPVVDSADSVNIIVTGGQAGRSVVFEGYGRPKPRPIAE